MEPLTKTNKESSAALGAFDRLFNVCQFLGLSAIAIAAIVGFGAELWRMVTADTIALGDLLLLFLYTEVMVMARAALHSHHELAIAMPIAIAIVAMGRYMVVSSDHNALHQMMYAGAIFILVAALFLWKMRVPSPVGRQARTTPIKKHAQASEPVRVFNG